MKTTTYNQTFAQKMIIMVAILFIMLPFMAVRVEAADTTAFKDVKAKAFDNSDLVEKVEAYPSSMNGGMNAATANYFILSNMGLVKANAAFLNMEEYDYIHQMANLIGGLIPEKEEEQTTVQLVSRGEFAVALAKAMKTAEKMEKVTVNGVTVVMSVNATAAEKEAVAKTMSKAESEALTSWSIYFDNAATDGGTNIGTKTIIARDAAQLETYVSRITLMCAMGMSF